MFRDMVPILIGDGCDNLIATRNEDGTFRVSASIILKQNFGVDTEATVEIKRALIHIEALDNGNDIFSVVVPQDESVTESFPEPSKEEWKLLGFNAPQED